jgi:hypothetical protein
MKVGSSSDILLDKFICILVGSGLMTRAGKSLGRTILIEMVTRSPMSVDEDVDMNRFTGTV